MPSAARPFAVFPRALSGSASMLGRGIERIGAASASPGASSSLDAKEKAIR
jgi:hypothetical protein